MNTFGTLRNIQDSEINQMLEWRNHPAVRANMYNQHEITMEEHLNWWEASKSSNRNSYFMYEYQGENSGIIGFNNIDQYNKNASWAFYASPQAKRGTGSRMEFLAIEMAFDSLKLEKLYCEVLAYNISVIKLHKKFGFKEEGVFRAQFKHHEDFIDIHRLGILKNEWLIQQEKMKEKLLILSKR